MVIRGHIQDGRVVLEGNVPLPEGAAVEVHVVQSPQLTQLNSADDAIYRIGELAEPTGIPDLAKNIDHYLYGHPKVDDLEQ